MAMTRADYARRHRAKKLRENPHLRLLKGRFVDSRVQPRRRKLWAPCDGCEPVHGTPGRYQSRTFPCRCPECTLAYGRWISLTPETRAEMLELRLEQRIARLNARPRQPQGRKSASTPQVRP